MDMRTLKDLIGKNINSAILKALSISALVDPDEEIRELARAELDKHIPYLAGVFEGDNQIFIALGAKDKHVPIYVTNMPKEFAGHKAEDYPYWKDITAKELGISETALTMEEIFKELFPQIGGRGGYKIIISPIEDHKVRDYSPNGVIERGNSKIKDGYRVGLKECSPKREFEKEMDVSNISDLELALLSLKAVYSVDVKEIYWAGKGDSPIDSDK